MNPIIRPHKEGFAVVFHGVLQANFFSGGCWFRLFGYGLNFLNRNIYPAAFYGRKQKQIFGWTCSVLTKSQIDDWEIYKNA